MADLIQFELVSPERRLVSRKVAGVNIPAAAGDLTAMAGHAPLITTLRPGILRIDGPEGADEYAVTGGFAEINGDSISVLAEHALHVSEVTREVLESFIAKAKAALEKAKAEQDHNMVDDAAKLLADLVAMGGHIGLDPNQPNF